MPRFVLLRHECPASYHKPSHWDFMLESGGKLQTWELRELPAAWVRQLGICQEGALQTVPAVRLPDHRVAYLDYEGPVSGNRGEVRRCDRGDCELISPREDALELLLTGSHLRGRAELSRDAGLWSLTVSEPS